MRTLWIPTHGNAIYKYILNENVTNTTLYCIILNPGVRISKEEGRVPTKPITRGNLKFLRLKTWSIVAIPVPIPVYMLKKMWYKSEPD